MQLETIIGLETHVQLKTATKLFCGCDNDSEHFPPNTNICPICLAHPGTLPVVNKQALMWAIRASQQLKCSIHDISQLDRKNYFYPDLPKAYQISQFGLPIGYEGKVQFYTPEGHLKEIRVERLHVEEDAAKSEHSKDGSATFIDFNRGGTPLMEIVTHPDFRNPADAKEYLKTLRLMMRGLGVSDADMEKGHLRCDANISLRPHGDDNLYPKTEIKNLNSFKALERALQYEIKRQTELWENNTPPQVLTTRGWDENTAITSVQREKEESHDYRYFPEPDLPPLTFTDVVHDHGKLCTDTIDQEINIPCIKNSLPERQVETVSRFVHEYRLLLADALALSELHAAVAFTENTFSELANLLKDIPELSLDSEETKIKVGKLVGGWLTTEVFKYLKDKELTFDNVIMTPHTFAHLLVLVLTKKITSPIAKQVLTIMIESEEHPKDIIKKKNLAVMSDSKEVEKIIDEVIAENEKVVEDYKGGKVESLKFLIGQVMRKSKGKADPESASELLKEKLS